MLDKFHLPIPPEASFDPSTDDPLKLVSFIHSNGKIGWGFQRVFKRFNAIFFEGDGTSLTEIQDQADAYIKKLN